MKTAEQLQAELEEALASITKLETKNSELIGREKSARNKAEEAEAARDEAAEKAERDAKDVEALEKRLTNKYEKEIKDLKAERDSALGDLKTIRVDNEIKTTLSGLGLKAEFVPVVEAYFHSKVQYEDGQASIDGKGIADWAKEWSAKDGAIYRPAPNNSGAGALGNDGSKATQFEIPKSEADISNDLMKLASTDPTQFNSIMTQAGLSIRA